MYVFLFVLSFVNERPRYSVLLINVISRMEYVVTQCNRENN